MAVAVAVAGGVVWRWGGCGRRIGGTGWREGRQEGGIRPEIGIPVNGAEATVDAIL